jgi:hypothetical protein
MHSRDDLSCTRGYEMWLLQEAVARNPAIKTYALSWGVPAWVGNGSYFSADNIAYQTAFAQCVKDVANVTLDYIGIWNGEAGRAGGWGACRRRLERCVRPTGEFSTAHTHTHVHTQSAPGAARRT